MTIDILFYTQIGSIIAFVVTLFVLYKLLVQQKDATIQLLNQQIDWLTKQIDALKETKPEKLLTILDNRIEVTNREISRLNKDREANLALVEGKREGKKHPTR